MAKQQGDPIYVIAKKIIREQKKVCVAGDSLNEEAIHHLRVATKKLRALLQLYRPYLSREVIKVQEDSVKALANQFALSRDEAVMQTTLADLFERYGDNQSWKSQLLLLQQLLSHGSHADETSAANPAEQLHSLQKNWKGLLPNNISLSFSKSIQYSYKKCRSLAQKARDSGRIEDYHRCRKWVKYYLYQLQLLDYPKSKGSKKYFQKLVALADLLGLLHDRDILESRLRGLTISGANRISELAPLIQQFQLWADQQKTLDKKQCCQLFDQLFTGHHCPLLD